MSLERAATTVPPTAQRAREGERERERRGEDEDEDEEDTTYIYMLRSMETPQDEWRVSRRGECTLFGGERTYRNYQISNCHDCALYFGARSRARCAVGVAVRCASRGRRGACAVWCRAVCLCGARQRVACTV